MEIKCEKCGNTKEFAFHRITPTNKECIAIDIVGADIKLAMDGADESIFKFEEDFEGLLQS